jgi:Tol biopolymer transport system component
MARNRARKAAGWAPLLVALLFVAPSAEAQYFGRNKVQYEKLDWRILKSDHFDNFFYPSESLIVNDAGRMAERWYTRHSETFRHAFDRKSLIFYADHPDFEQTNVIGETLEEGTGGVTEGLRTRVIMPFTGIYADNDHVLGHELVHVFQYNIAEAAPAGGLARLNALPLWLIEGMAEYFSLGRNDPLTAMWMRDAVMNNRFPTIKQLTTDPRYFPYRYGQALWAYIGGKWGDRAIVDVYRTALKTGWDPALIRVLGINSDSLSKEWAAANRAMYAPALAARIRPDSMGQQVVGLGKRLSEQQNVSPSVSPDGKYVAFVSSLNLFTNDVYIADAHTGEIIKRLGGANSDPHFDAISFINSSGDWSPDATRFAFVVYADGNNEIAVFNTNSADVERRIKVPNVGAISSVSWSPDGNTLAIAGQHGGISDLFLLDMKSGTLKQLTNDRYADIQPTWSPDGRTLAFATDRGQQTDFNLMRFSPLQIATIDVASGQIGVVFSPFPQAVHNVNPQWTPDGKDILFISDPDGVPNIYRLNLASAQARRVTNVATGVSGITSISPAITVARKTGRLLFTVFQSQGYAIRALDADATNGVPVVASGGGEVATTRETSLGLAPVSALPPGDVTRSIVTSYLAAPADGLVSGADFKVVPYHSSFQLDALGQPQVGVQAGGPFGTGLAGGVSAFFGDQLSDKQIATVAYANGTVKDIGGAVMYQNLKNRWNYGAGVQHLPYLTGYAYYDTLSVGGRPAFSTNQLIQRIYIDEASLTTAYPFSMTRRIEFNAAVTRLGFESEVFSYVYDQQTLSFIGQDHSKLPGAAPIVYFQPEIALVGDNSFGAFTSPVTGQRYRISVAPSFGTFNFQNVLADYRRYMYARPFTFAFRALHYGRYGRDGENPRLSPIYLGEEQLVRGYGLGSIDFGTECPSTQSCAVFNRMLGSRIGVANLEFRIPLFGTREFGLLNFPFVPTEIAPFFDAGIAYTSDQHPVFKYNNSYTSTATCSSNSAPTDPNSLPLPCAERTPVFSTGLSARMNVLGYLILEAYVAHPFQRPAKNWVMGFQLAPGW